MSDNRKYVQAQTFTLAGSGAIATATSVILSSFLQIDGSTTLTMTNFGTKGFGTCEPNNGTQEEAISFTGITQNSDGTATLTGVKTVLFIDPYTETSGLARAHPGGSKFIITNTAGFYSEFLNKNDDETVAGKFTFPNDDVSNAGIASDTDTAVATAFVTLGQLSRQAISGASNASTTVKGIVELSTQAEMDAKTTTGGTGALLVPTPNVMRSTLKSDYVVDTGTATAFAIAPSPAITAYTPGQEFTFKASHANTGTSTLNVNGLGAVPLKAQKTNLRAEYIRTNYAIGVVYTGSEFEITSASAQVQVSQDGKEIFARSTTGTTAFTIGLVPIVSRYTIGAVYRFIPDTGGGHATLNVNSLGAKNINVWRSGASTAVLTGDILANQSVEVMDAGTNFEMLSPPGKPLVFSSTIGTRVANAGNGSVNYAHGLGRVPNKVKITAMSSVAEGAIGISNGVFNGTTTSCVYGYADTGSGNDQSGTSATNIVQIYVGDADQLEVATVTMDATNIILSWTESGSPGAVSIKLLFEVQ